MYRKNEYLHFRVTPREQIALERLTQQEGRNLSEMLRELVREGALRRGLWQVEDPAKEAGPVMAGAR